MSPSALIRTLRKEEVILMILQTANNTVYYPTSKSKVSGLIHSSTRIRYFRGTVLVSRKSLSVRTSTR
jgi:hypothetical protein